MSLLDIFNTDAGRQALGLMAAGGPVTDPNQTWFRQRMQSAVGSFDAWKQKKVENEQNTMKFQMLQARQMQEMQVAQQLQLATAAKAKEDVRIQAIVSGAGRVSSPMLGNTSGDTPAGVALGKIDFQDLFRQGVPFKTLESLAATQNLGRDEVARVQEIEGPNGTKLLQGFTKFGDRVGQGEAGYLAPQLVGQGDRQTFVKPSAGLSLPTFQDANSRASNATTQRGQNMVDARARDAQAVASAAGRKPQFHDGQWVSPPSAANPGGAVVAVPGFQKPLGETAKKTLSGIESLNGAIGEYVTELKGWSNKGAFNPDARAAMGTKYNNMMLQAKEAYNLGVLNGPDYEILQAVITDPRSAKGFVTSNKAMEGQATELSRIVSKVTAPAVRGSGAAAETTAAKAAPNPLPANASAKNLTKGTSYELPNGQVGVWDGMRFKGQ